jgi:carboxyl-terminal processing protease
MKKFMMATVVGTLAGGLLATQVAGPLLAQEADQRASVYEQLDLFGDIFERIRAQYVEEVNSEGADRSRDQRHAHLARPAFELPVGQRRRRHARADARRIRRPRDRGHAGEGFVKVVSPMDGTPADDAGIQAGDFITHVDGQSVLGLTLDQAVEMMRGPVGSEIIITVVREGTPEPFDVSIIRETIKLTAVRTRAVGDTVVLRVTTFNDQTFPNLEEGMRKESRRWAGWRT